MKNDPFEQVNLATNKEHAWLKEEMLKKLKEEKERLNFKYPDNYKPAPTEPEMEDWRKGN